MRNLKLLFTDKDYRWTILESLELKLLSLSGIRHIVTWYYAFIKK